MLERNEGLVLELEKYGYEFSFFWNGNRKIVNVKVSCMDRSYALAVGYADTDPM